MLSEDLNKVLNKAYPAEEEWAQAVYGGRLGGLTKDAAGNLTRHFEGTGKKLLVVAPTAVEGLIADSLDEKGNLHCLFTKGIDTRNIFNRALRFSCGAEGVMRPVACNGSDPTDKKPQELTADDMYVDFGMPFYKTGVRPGDTAVLDATVRTAAPGVLCGARFTAAVPCEALAALISGGVACGRDVTFAFVSDNGLPYLLRSLCPDEVLFLGIFPAQDGPDGEKNGLAVKFDGGPAVMLRLGNVSADRGMTERFFRAAGETGIPVQTAYRREYGSAEAAAASGAAVAEITVPVRHIGGGELLREDEFDRFIRLTGAFIASND